MRKVNDHTGKNSGKWSILRRVSEPGAHEVMYECRCACGTIRIKEASSLFSKNVPIAVGCNKCHRVGRGEFSGWEKEKRTWDNMHKRCYVKSNNGYANYGAKGVRVCERWKESFWNFVEDIGKISTGMSIDRIDPNGDYCPENCRLIPRNEQNWNKRKTVWLTINGKTMQLGRWLKLYKTPWCTYFSRKRRGMSTLEAVTAPKQYIGMWKGRT